MLSKKKIDLARPPCDGNPLEGVDKTRLRPENDVNRKKRNIELLYVHLCFFRLFPHHFQIGIIFFSTRKMRVNEKLIFERKFCFLIFYSKFKKL